MQFTKSQLTNKNGFFRQLALKVQFLNLIEYKSKQWHKLALFYTIDGENISKFIVMYDGFDTKEYFFIEEKNGKLQLMEVGWSPSLNELDKELMDKAIDICKNVVDEIKKHIEDAVSNKTGKKIQLNRPYKRNLHITEERSYFDKFFDFFSKYV